MDPEALDAGTGHNRNSTVRHLRPEGALYPERALMIGGGRPLVVTHVERF
jgi:hypothetical protein